MDEPARGGRVPRQDGGGFATADGGAVSWSLPPRAKDRASISSASTAVCGRAGARKLRIETRAHDTARRIVTAAGARIL